jgi:N-acetylglucosamine-6-phosphate deacetylase
LTTTLLHRVRVMQPGEGVVGDAVAFDAGRITWVGQEERYIDRATRIDGEGALLTPGMIDLHTHGIHQHLYEASPQGLVDGLRVPPRHGTTTVLPTLYTVMHRSKLRHLESLAEALGQVTDVHVPGFHLEGPFLALPGAGAATIDGDTGLLGELLAACRGRAVAMSISPDTPGIVPVIERLVERGVAAFITHTRAAVDQTQAAIDAGARHATHFYDVFPLPPEIEPGVRPVGAVETILADARCTVDFIADGVHVHPMAIRAALAAKSWRGVTLITDSNIGAGLPAGEYDTTLGYRVRVRPGDAARVADATHPLHGGLAGSALTMDQGVRNLASWLDAPLHEVIAMATCNPAAVIGRRDCGRIAPGCRADLVLWDEQLRPLRTWVGGRLIAEVSTV